MDVKLIGIDPGLAATGLGLVTGNGRRVSDFAYGVIRTDPNTAIAKRLEKIYRRIHDILTEEKPEMVVLEDVFSLEKFPKSGIMLGKVCGVILLAAEQAALRVEEIPVREAKQVLTGNGNADKVQLEKSVRRTLGCAKPIRPYHASDALGLAIIGLFRYARSCPG
jgi:crossover junction endodeoxyribonuclease RuvC